MSVGEDRIVTMFGNDIPGSDDSRTLESLLPFTESGAAALEGLSGDELLELLAAWDRAESKAAAGKRAIAAALEERFAPRIVAGRQGRVEVKGLAACEIAMRLGISPQRAGVLVGEGMLFNGVLADVGLALSEGLIDAGKAGSFATVLGDEEAAVAFAVMDTLLPVAPGKTHAQLDKALRAELIRVDPAAAAKRFERAMRLRRLERVQLRPDGMASIRLVGAVFDVARVYVHADSVARATKATGDERTLDQLRADTIVTLIDGHQAPPRQDPPNGPNGPDAPKAPADSHALEVSAAAVAMAALTPAEVGALPIRDWSAYRNACNEVAAGHSDDLSEREQITRLIAGLRKKSRHRQGTRHGPPIPPPTERRPLAKATGPASKLTLLLASTDLHAPGLERPDSRPTCLAESYRNELYAAPNTSNGPGEGTHSGEALPLAEALPDSPATLPVALLGRDVPYLLGFGPLDPTTARALITDHPANLTITVYDDLEAGHTRWIATAPENRHDPCPALQRHLAAYYPTCIAPTCTARATICDNDHIIEYPLGPTHVTNLRPLCRHHHLLKTHAGHRLERDENGSLNWITPLGTTRPTQHQRPPHHLSDLP